MAPSIRFSILTAVIAFLFIARVDASPTLFKRATPGLTVQITSTTDYCLIVPSTAHTNIGDSENGGGGAVSYCTGLGGAGVIPSNFWTSVTLSKLTGVGAIIQLTGCINSATLDRLNIADGGGQYDSSGGDGGFGNPAGSVCTGYNHYVELIEPASNRACIRCCVDPADCVLSKDTSGCPEVIQGEYGLCA